MTDDDSLGARKKFQVLIEQLPAVTFTGSLDGGDLYVSPQIVTLLGFTAQECVDDPSLWHRQLHPDDCALLQNELARGCGGEGQLRADCRFFSRTGEIVWVHGEAQLIRDVDGNPIGLQGIAFDISETKRALQEKEALFQELQVAHEAALESARLKSQFLANMSHELRTPLNGVLGAVHLLSSTDPTPRQCEYIDTIRSCGEVLLSTVDDVLDFERSSGGRMPLESIELDLRAMLDAVLEMLQPEARKKSLELCGSVLEEVPRRVIGDPTRIRQILINLVGNALKFTAAGKILVRVMAASESKTSVHVRFEVSDTGVGLSEDMAGQLFQPFTQADGSTTRKYGGAGLGLAICKQLVELMGGEIGVESEPAKGSRFWFTVELRKGESLSRYPTLEGKRVLVVDDDPTHVELTALQLRSWNAQVDTASNAREALSALRRASVEGQPYALALLDAEMPDMNGFDLARLAQAGPTPMAVPMVVLSAYSDLTPYRPEGARVSAVLRKPVPSSQLYNTILGVLRDPGQMATRDQLAGSVSVIDVLLVEDNQFNQQVATRMLEALGCRVELADNGIQALEALEARAYAMIFMDCQMPEMDGYEATRELRRREHGSGHRIPVIAMTAHALSGDRDRCLQSGMDDYLTKPVRPDLLKTAVERWSRPAPSTAAAPSPPERAVIDPVSVANLKSLAGGDKAFLGRLLAAFESGARGSLERMTAGVGSADALLFKQAAHTLAGAAANLGAASLSSACREAEMLAMTRSVEAAGERLGAISEELERVLGACRQTFG